MITTLLILTPLVGVVSDRLMDVRPLGSTSPPASRSEAPRRSTSPPGDKSDELPPELIRLFKQLDTFGRGRVHALTFVKLHLREPKLFGRRWERRGWLVSEDEQSVTILMDDHLIPWTFAKKSSTQLPGPAMSSMVRLRRASETDFERYCRILIAKGRRIREPFVGVRLNRVFAAHAAWKRGLNQYCVPILSANPTYEKGLEAYVQAVLEDASFTHFTRGVTLLRHADRAEVVAHLELAARLAPATKRARRALKLAADLRPLLAQQERSEVFEDKVARTDQEQVKRLVRQLVNLHCIMDGFGVVPSPYHGTVVGSRSDKLPSVQLRELGTKAVPTLIETLTDHTPTRTVDRGYSVWRRSDFALLILHDITGKWFEIPLRDRESVVVDRRD